MEHAVHVSSKHFVEGLAPTANAKLMRKLKSALDKSKASNNEYNLDAIEDELTTVLAGSEEDCMDYDSDAEDAEQFAAGDVMGKALALVKQVYCYCLSIGEGCVQYACQIRASPQATAFFKQTCEDVDLPMRQLLLWIRTRWASLFYCLDRLLELKKVCPCWIAPFGSCANFPRL